MNLFEDMNANNINYKLGQSWAKLTGMDPIIAFFLWTEGVRVDGANVSIFYAL